MKDRPLLLKLLAVCLLCLALAAAIGGLLSIL